jgi:hypothetical protein
MDFLHFQHACHYDICRFQCRHVPARLWSGNLELLKELDYVSGFVLSPAPFATLKLHVEEYYKP